jgi:ABC-type lipoprotein release transport system permease subunit
MGPPLEKYLVFLVLLTAMTFSQVVPPVGAADIEVTCVITEEGTGTPLEGAEVQVLRRRNRYYTSRRWQTVDSGVSDENGVVTLSVDDGQRYLFITSLDEPGTEGYDYVPRVRYHSIGEEAFEIETELSKGASLRVAGQGYLVETTAIPTTSYVVVDPDTQIILQDPEAGFRYGSIEFSINHFIGVRADVIVVPVDTSFYLQVRSTTEIEGNEFSYNFVIEEFQESHLEQGGVQDIDLREYTVEPNIMKSREFLENITKVIDGKEEDGFFLAIEKYRLGSVKGLIDEAEDYVAKGSYELAFTMLREAFVELSDISSSVLGMTTEAIRSVYVLVAFFALSSTIIGFVVYDDFIKKIMASSVVYAVMLVSLQYLHPGNQLVPRGDYVSGSVAVFVGVQAVGLYLPRFLQSKAQGDRGSLVNMTVPILSIAKRSLRRRGLRFGLTLMTILLLVASFISLTSFTSGYGLTIEKTSGESLKPKSVIVRPLNPNPQRALATFSGGDGVTGPPPMDEDLLSWFSTRPDSVVVAPKVESHASKQYREFNIPVAFVDGVPLFGVMGIIPSEEAGVNDIQGALVNGRYLADDELDTVMISSQLAGELRIGVGDSIWFEMYGKELWLEVVGVLDDETLQDLGDIDGGSILPNKIIEVGRTPLDGPDIVTEGLTPCDAGETVIINMETAGQLSGLWLARIDIVIGEDASVLEYARMVALNKGQRVWASIEDGVYAVSLASYNEGKGFPVIIPWVIVILNVIVTMLNSYYERRHEVMIYSSIGMNPSHVSVVFLAEAAVLGLIGGSLGYILGLGAYKVIYILTPALQVKQKISAIWSLAAIGISLAAVFIGGYISQRSSTTITPSLKRKWQVNIDKTQGFTRIVLPLKVHEVESEGYYRFVLDQLVEESNKWDYRTMRIIEKRGESSEEKKVIDFVYCSADIKFGGVYTRNKLIIEKKGDIFETSLRAQGNPADKQLVGSFFRKIGIEYSLSKSD